MVWNIKQLIKNFKELLKDKEFCNLHYEDVEKIKLYLKSKKEFEKYYRRMNIFSEKGDMLKDFLKNLESDKNSIIKNHRLEEKHKNKLLEELKESKIKGIKNIKEAEEYFKN